MLFTPGHPISAFRNPLLEVKRTSLKRAAMSGFDPKAELTHNRSLGYASTSCSWPKAWNVHATATVLMPLAAGVRHE
jgi:hypothetical protein